MQRSATRIGPYPLPPSPLLRNCYDLSNQTFPDHHPPGPPCWAATNISISPGNTVKVVLDPQNLVAETDETNNEFTTVFQGVPAVSRWGLIVMVVLVLTVGAVTLWRRHPAAA